MRATIDLTEDAGYASDGLPPTVIHDDGDVVITFGDVEIRMTCLQFTRFLTAANEWMQRIPPEDTCEVAE